MSRIVTKVSATEYLVASSTPVSSTTPETFAVQAVCPEINSARLIAAALDYWEANH